MTSEKIVEYVESSLKNEELSEYQIEVHGNSNKDDGYIGNITYVTVTGKTIYGDTKCLHLVIKWSKESINLRKETPIKEAFEKEIYIYDKVRSTFKQFQEEMGNRDLLDYVPKCYGTAVTEERELLILENLKTQGYDLWDRRKPMTFDHIRLILEAYGKWHAFSYALKRKNPKTFSALVNDNPTHLFSYWIMKINMYEVLFEIYEKARTSCNISINEKKKVKFSVNEFRNTFVGLFEEETSDRVILHGDGWTNNFLFKTQKGTEKPTSVRILDWQLSAISSPVIDLSYFIYTCVDTETYKDVRELLIIYHNSLKECLNYLGCEAENIFSFEQLLHHWRKFSRFGLVMSTFVMKFSLCEAEDAPDFAEAAENGKSFVENLRFTLKNEKLYFKRVGDNFLHYIQNLQ